MERKKMVVIFGAECTGKTTLAKQLAEHYQTLWVPEYLRKFIDARDFVKKEGQIFEPIISKEEVREIALGQYVLENTLVHQSKKDVIFLDTNLLMNKLYAQYYLGIDAEYFDQLIKEQDYVMYLFLRDDIPWEKDEQRDSPEVRAVIDQFFYEALQKQSVPWKEIRGKGEERLQKAIAIIDQLGY